MSERRVFFGTLALSCAQAAKFGLQLAVLPVLARILGPQSYGLVAIAMPFILLANMLSDAGLGSALVRVENPSRDLESTAFWLSGAVCVGLTIILALAAVPVSQLLHAPKLPPILLTLSLVLIISGSLSVPNARIMRQRRFAVFAVSDVVSSVSAACAAIAAALAGWGPWSLVVQQLVLWIVKSAWIACAARFVPAMICRPALVASHVSFGVHAAASGVADFFGKNAPTVLVGGLLGVLAAGQYSMAFQLTRLLDSLISGPIYVVIFTAIAQLGERRAQAAEVAMRGLRGVAIVLAPAFAGLAAVADLLVKLLLGPKWAASAAVLALLAPFGFLLCLLSIVGAALMGLGRSQAQFRLTVLSGVASCLGGLAGAPFGLKGVALGLSLGAVAVTPVYFQALARELRMGLAALAGELAPPIVAALAMLAVVFALRAASRGTSEWAQLILAVGGGLLSFTAILALMYGRRLLSDVRSILPGSVLSEPNPS